MYIMLSKQMESVKNIGKNCFTNTNMDKDAKDVTLRQYQNLVVKKSRRFRSAFTTEQVNYLEKEFKKFPYIEISNRKDIADKINISERAVKIWFQNRRMREKKENGTNYQYGIINKMAKSSENNYSNDINNDVFDESATKEKELLSGQNRPQHFESAKISETNNNNDKTKKLDYYMDQFTKLSPKIRNNTIIPPISSTAQVNMCSFYNNLNRTSKSKCFENSNRVSPTSQHIKRDLPQDLSYKNRLAEKSMLSNPQYVSVNGKSEQKYLPMYNFCTTSLPIGAPVMTGYSVPTGSTVSQGNVIWKPMNMQPPSNMPPVRMIQNNGISLASQNTTRSCSCNCHELPQSHSTTTGFNQDPRIQPQYLLAIPLNNACNQA